MIYECLNCKENYSAELEKCPKCDFPYIDVTVEANVLEAKKLIELLKTYSCPSCKKINALKHYVDTLSTLQQMTQGASARTNPQNAIKGGISFLKSVFSSASSEKRRDAEQSICTFCKKFCVNCPYCMTVNSMSGKISYEFQPETCKSCKKEFDVYIFNA